MLQTICFFFALFIGQLSSAVATSAADQNYGIIHRQQQQCLPNCGCDEKWAHVNGSEYRAFLFPDSAGSYFEAFGLCSQLGATLTVITTPEENEFVAKFVASAYVPEEGNVPAPQSRPTLWTGMHRLRGNPITYYTDSGERWGFGIRASVPTPGGPTTSPWLPGQPSGNATYTPSCVHIVSENATQNWASYACRLNLAGYICERKCTVTEECRRRH